jgi:multicomponent Na+:H+ antiporter subunit E
MVVGLALAWVALTGDVSVASVAFGVVLGVVALRIARPLGPSALGRPRPVALLGLVAFVAWEVVVANLQVAAAVLGPRRRLRPALVAVPLELEGEDRQALLANLVSLTPGTLSLDVSPDGRTLYVHAMFVSSPEALRRAIKDGYERRVREAFP